MTRVTGKSQITLLKRLVDAFGIRVGDEVELVAAGQPTVAGPETSCTTVVALVDTNILINASIRDFRRSRNGRRNCCGRALWVDRSWCRIKPWLSLLPLQLDGFQDRRRY
jgi:hypothetical protein